MSVERKTLLIAAALLLSLFQMPAALIGAEPRQARTRQAGEWDDWRTWELRNEVTGTWELLPEGWYPGCEHLRQVHVWVEHHVHLRPEMEVHVAAVTAVSAELLQVEGDLIVDIGSDYVDPGIASDVAAVAGVEAPSPVVSISELFPNPATIHENGELVVDFVLTGQECERLEIRLVDAAGVGIGEPDIRRNIRPGRHTVRWTGQIAAGSYFVLIDAPGVRYTRTLMVLK